MTKELAFASPEQTSPQARYWGMRMEYQTPPSKALSYAVLSATKAFEHIEQPVIEGKLPSEGPGLLVFTHYKSIHDILLLAIAAMRAGRSLRFVGKETLVDATAREDPKVAARFGKKDIFNSDTFAGKTVRHITEALCAPYEVISTPREKIAREFLDTIANAFEKNQLVALSLYATRNPPRGLRDAKAGSALLGKMHPDIPIIPVALWYADPRRRSNDKHSVNVVIEEPFTYNEIPFPEGCDYQLGFAHRYIVRKIATHLPYDLKAEWVQKYGDSFPPAQ